MWGEAAALPNFNRAVANWHPPQERGLGIGITIGGIGIGSAMTPPITAWIMVNYGWQMAFYIAGALGIGIALLWFWYATDRPQDHSHVNTAEAQFIGEGSTPISSPHTPWASFFRTPTVWWIIFSYTCLGYVAYNLYVLVLSLSRECPGIRCAERGILCFRTVYCYGDFLPSRRMGHGHTGSS